MNKFFAALSTFLVVVGLLFYLGKQQSGTPPVPTLPMPPDKLYGIEEALGEIDENEIRTSIFWLASPKLEGRMSGKKGNEAARDYLANYYKSLGLEVSLQTFPVQNLNNFTEQGSGSTSNVVAWIPGTDLSGEVLVVGAHYDHIGYGPSFSRTPGRVEVHPGADDNASGTAALMGVAKALAKLKGKNRRKIVFISFSGEELGLIGSKYYVANPVHPGTVFMLNMDMVGRLNGKPILEVACNSQEAVNILSRLKGYPFKPQITSGVSGGSDHAAFSNRGIPVCCLHTGLHPDYHTPEDTADKIDYVGVAKISKFAAHLIWELDRGNKKPARMEEKTTN